MSVIAPVSTGQIPDTVTRSPPLTQAATGNQTAPVAAPASTGSQPATVAPSPPINQNGTSGTLINTTA
jgi:hypothetical protein